MEQPSGLTRNTTSQINDETKRFIKLRPRSGENGGKAANSQSFNTEWRIKDSRTNLWRKVRTEKIRFGTLIIIPVFI